MDEYRGVPLTNSPKIDILLVLSQWPAENPCADDVLHEANAEAADAEQLARDGYLTIEGFLPEPPVYQLTDQGREFAEGLIDFMERVAEG